MGNCKYKNENYQKEYRENNKEYFKEYLKNYYEENKGNFVYMLMNKFDEPIYIGSTNNLRYRCRLHLNGYSNLEMDREELAELHDFERIVYWDFKGFNRADTRYLEQLFIDKYQPVLNKYTNVIVDYNKLSVSIDKLVDVLEEIEDSYQEYEM